MTNTEIIFNLVKEKTGIDLYAFNKKVKRIFKKVFRIMEIIVLLVMPILIVSGGVSIILWMLSFSHPVIMWLYFLLCLLLTILTIGFINIEILPEPIVKIYKWIGGIIWKQKS